MNSRTTGGRWTQPAPPTRPPPSRALESRSATTWMATPRRSQEEGARSPARSRSSSASPTGSSENVRVEWRSLMREISTSRLRCWCARYLSWYSSLTSAGPRQRAAPSTGPRRRSPPRCRTATSPTRRCGSSAPRSRSRTWRRTCRSSPRSASATPQRAPGVLWCRGQSDRPPWFPPWMAMWSGSADALEEAARLVAAPQDGRVGLAGAAAVHVLPHHEDHIPTRGANRDRALIVGRLEVQRRVLVRGATGRDLRGVGRSAGDHRVRGVGRALVAVGVHREGEPRQRGARRRVPREAQAVGQARARRVADQAVVVVDGSGLHRDDDLGGQGRSEEHTSELQSRENLVCRLLLEKKDLH